MFSPGREVKVQVNKFSQHRFANAKEAAAKKRFIDSISWKTEGSGPLGAMASLAVPSGYRFTGSPGTIKLMEAFGNLTSGSELGFISPLD